MNKRKRGPSLKRQNVRPAADIDMVDLTEDEPVAGPSTNQVTTKAAPSSSTTVDVDKQSPPKLTYISPEPHNFAVPDISKPIVRTKIKGKELVVRPTAEQDRMTSSCRQMRRAVIQVISDFHHDIKKQMDTDCSCLLKNLWICWKKYPLMFAHSSKVLKVPREDFSTSSEIKDFLPWWLHGLSSLLFFPELQSHRNDIKELLTTIAQCLIYGNPELVEVCFLELLKVLLEFSKPVRQAMTLTLGNQESASIKQLEIKFKLEEDDDEAICDFLEVLRVFLPQVFHFKVVQRQRFLIVLRDLWRRLNDRSKYKFFSTFMVPVMPLLPSAPIPTEILTVTFVAEVIVYGLQHSDPQHLRRFVHFCDLMWKGVIPFSLFPDTFLLRLHDSISKLIVCGKFNSIPTDAQRQGIVKLYLSLTEKKTKMYKGDEDGKLGGEDVKLFLKASDSSSLIEISHPLLEEAVFNDLTQAFHAYTSANILANPVPLWNYNNREKRKTQISCMEQSTLWKELLIDFESKISPTNQPAGFEALKKSCYTMELAGRVNSRLVKYVVQLNSETRTGVMWMPNFEFLNFDIVQKWTNFSKNCILQSLSANSGKPLEKVMIPILDALEWFQKGDFVYFRPSLELLCQWITIVCVPWITTLNLQKFIETEHRDDDFYSNLCNFSYDKVSPVTKGRCMRALGLQMFLPYKDVVFEIVWSMLDNFSDRRCIVEMLDMISSFSWTIRNIRWNYLVEYILGVIFKLDWRHDAEIRNKIASAIVVLPCFFSNQKQKLLAANPSDRLKLEYQECSICQDGGKGEDESCFLPKKDIFTFLQLSLHILESNFLIAKLELIKLITSARNHSRELSTDLIAVMTTTAVRGSVSLGTEIMKHLSFYIRPLPVPLDQDQVIPEVFDRNKAIQVLFFILEKQLESFIVKRKFVRFSIKVLISLQQLAVNADQQMMVEILKFVLRILVVRDSNVISMLSQYLVGVMASQRGCSTWELFTRLRFELAEEILKLAMKYCCDPTIERDVQVEKCRGFFNGICTMGEFRTSGIFIHHFYPILLGFMVPTLRVDINIQFVFKVMTEFATLTASQILHDGFHNYYRALVLGHKIEKVQEAFLFLKNKYNLDPNVVAYSVLQSTLNEMLCHLNERKEKVVKFVPQLLRRDGSGFSTELKAVARSEIQELISKHLFGFFVFVDTKLHSRLESVWTKRRILQSFTVLIEVMGKTRMTSNRTKVYATLNSLFSLGPDFHDLLYEAWKMFSLNLENAAFGQMSAQILAAVLVLREKVPKKVDSLISLFVVSKKELTISFHQELYFLLDYTEDSNVRKMISDCVSQLRSKSWGSYFELLVKESSNENSHIRYRAIKKIHNVLIEEYENLYTIILDQEHPVVSQLLNSLLKASRDVGENNEMLMLLAESFGSLGAVDPYRFKDPEGEELKRKTTPTFTVTGPHFAARFLDLLIREFQESEDTTDFDYCACLIQQVLKHFNVQPLQNDPVWYTMSNSARQLIEPLLTSKYKVEKALPKPVMSCPIYLSENGKCFDRWLSNWLSLMITYVKEGTPAYELFKFTKYMIPRNNRIASFLLPYVSTFAVIGGNSAQKLTIVKEIENILQRWIEQDAMKVNSQLMMIPIKENQIESGIIEVETPKLADQDVFQYRCTQEIFSVFDHLFRGVRHAKRQAGLLKANLNRPPSRPVDPINPSLSEEHADTISRVLSQIPMGTVSQVAFHCEDYTRALFYLEQDLKRNPDKLDDNLNYLQQLYVSLGDMDSVIGISAVRKGEPPMSETIMENIAKGKIEAAVRSLEFMVTDDPNDLIAHNGLLQAYLNVDEPRKAESLIKACVSRNPQWEMALQEAQIQASWKLRDWSKLKEELLDSDSSSNNQDDTYQPPPVSWNMTIIKILSFVKDLELEEASEMLKEARVKSMTPLVAAARRGSRGYPNVVQLHILTEVEQVINILMENNSDGQNLPMVEHIKSLHNKWDSRLSLLLKSQKFIDPVLDVRRTLLETLKESLYPNQETIKLIDGSIRDCWLEVATVESKAGNFTRASNCLVEAKKYMSAKVMIEQAKLLSRKGDKGQAINILVSGLSNYFPRSLEWTKKSNVPYQAGNEERKLCAKALLLHAKLCDEQQLLDFEENIKNYKSSTEVFRESEKNFYTLASYYDRMWSNKEEKAKQADVQSMLVRYYALSLHYGCKYVYQSLPRLLSIWFDYSSIGFSSQGRAPISGSIPEEWSSTVNQMQETIKKVMKEVPTYVMLTAFPQLISRLCHGNPSVWELLKEIINAIICNHPHQALWMTMAVSKSSYEMRQRRCKEIYQSVERKRPGLKQTIHDYTLLADKLIAVCIKDVGQVQKASISQISKTLPKLLCSPNFSEVLMPYQVFLSPSLPLKGSSHKSHDAFPQKLVFIRGVEETVSIMASLQKPKKINLIGSNGKSYGLLCKAKDDLRKDCKVMEVNNVVNWYLHRNPESRERQLHVRMYAVSPLNEEHGLLEWVPDLSGFRGNMLSIYRERGINFSMKDMKTVLRSSDPIALIKFNFLNKLVKPHPPCFSEWFLNNFNDPQSWYKARLCYTRTAAVMSIVGFVLGLGDRHGENILLDSSTGDIVHVDFNCLFNKGETFDVPERVPFRLTQNMIEAMGPLGVEGVFRRSCEITMSMIREHKSIFLSVIHPFVFDPLVEWGSSGSGRKSGFTGEMTNDKAVEHMKHINNRIDGSARNMTKDKNTELSVEAQVAYLIDEARSVENLCRMYIGWTAFF